MKIEPKLVLLNQSNIEVPVADAEFKKIASVVFKGEGKQFAEIEVVFLNDDDIQKMNKEYLNHDFITDVITFPYQENEIDDIDGSIFIGANQVFRQAEELEIEPQKEFLRIIIHGLLHLCAYTDNTEDEKRTMTEREDYYLCKIDF